MKSDLARRFAGNADHRQRTDLIPRKQVVVQLGALSARVSGVVGVNGGSCTGPLAHQIGGPGMVPVGEKNPGNPETGDVPGRRLVRFDGIDAKIPFGVANEVPVEVIPVRLGKP